MVWHNSANGFICLFFVDADVLRQPFTLQKALGFLHRLAQKEGVINPVSMGKQSLLIGIRYVKIAVKYHHFYAVEFLF